MSGLEAGRYEARVTARNSNGFGPAGPASAEERRCSCWPSGWCGRAMATPIQPVTLSPPSSANGSVASASK